ncbi:MAG TPA: TIGR00366 family protein [Flavobacteriaceae bacterium]|nr:TIGR00366 family protein [Flavobacteriaceae bacterium]
MNFTRAIETLFRRFLPSPFTIAVLLTLVTILLALVFTNTDSETPQLLNILSYWQEGIWNDALLVFAYQMMLILVLGHVLVLSTPVNRLILMVSKSVTGTVSAVIFVSVTTMLVAFFNWGLGLIFGAVLARKIGEYAQAENIPLNYPVVGASGYVGLMVWHGGISGSAPIKVAESGHLAEIMQTINPTVTLPDAIAYNQTVFSWWNLTLFAILLILVPLVLALIAKKLKPTTHHLSTYTVNDNSISSETSGKLDKSRVFALFFGMLMLFSWLYFYRENLRILQITPNMLNVFMFALALLLHGTFNHFFNALNEAIKGTTGILIQFPLYFGIMGIMKSSGLIVLIASGVSSFATSTTLPIWTFFSAGLVNVFVPSGGGQWAVQGPIVIETALQLGVPLPKAIMALAYGDQITNMLQPFWALPLLAITQLKAKEILPYTLIVMLVGILVYTVGLLLI